MTNEPEKPEKRFDEMDDRELAEYVLGKELVERLHADFDLRDGNEGDDDHDPDFISPE